MRSRGIRGAILIVEDAEPAAATLEVALAGIGGREVLIASTGAEALRVIGDGTPAIQAVVTDLNMPVMDGLEFIRRLRSDRRFSSLPVIVVSGETDPNAPQQALGVGADAYFSKPYSPSQVRNELEQLLNANGTREI